MHFDKSHLLKVNKLKTGEKQQNKAFQQSLPILFGNTVKSLSTIFQRYYFYKINQSKHIL